MSIDSFLLIAKIGNSLSVLGFLMTLIRIRRRSIVVKLLGLILFFGVLSYYTAFVLYDLKINPNYASSIYYILTFPILVFIYFHALGRRQVVVFLIIALVALIFMAINMVYLQKANINSYSYVLNSLICIVLALYYFYYLLREMPTIFLFGQPMFWINAGIFIFNSGTFLLYISISYLVNVLNNNLLVYWSFHNILNIVEQLVFVVAIAVELRNIYSPIKQDSFVQHS